MYVLDWTKQCEKSRDCQSVELRALCNEVPRTPPGPEGSNGIGKASGAADHPKFLAPCSRRCRLFGQSGGWRDAIFHGPSHAMSYQVIARKWRPQTFNDLVGQAHVTETLGNAIRNN